MPLLLLQSYSAPPANQPPQASPEPEVEPEPEKEKGTKRALQEDFNKALEEPGSSQLEKKTSTQTTDDFFKKHSGKYPGFTPLKFFFGHGTSFFFSVS